VASERLCRSQIAFLQHETATGDRSERRPNAVCVGGTLRASVDGTASCVSGPYSLVHSHSHPRRLCRCIIRFAQLCRSAPPRVFPDTGARSGAVRDGPARPLAVSAPSIINATDEITLAARRVTTEETGPAPLRIDLATVVERLRHASDAEHTHTTETSIPSHIVASRRAQATFGAALKHQFHVPTLKRYRNKRTKRLLMRPVSVSVSMSLFILNANVFRRDEDRHQRRSGTSI